MSGGAAWISGGFSVGALVTTGVVSAVLSAVAAKRERETERLTAVAASTVVQRRREETEGSYLAFLAGLPVFHERFVKLVAAAWARYEVHKAVEAGLEQAAANGEQLPAARSTETQTCD